MDAFFAAVEQKRHPELTGRPVVIGGRGDPTERGVVSTASYEARKFGIHSAMPLRTAYRLCPHAVFLPVDYMEYSRVSVRIKEILREFSAAIEDGGIDEAFIDMSHSDRPSDEIAKEIKKRIRQETGLTCSVGIAPNKLLAKIASDMQKPDGITIITENDVETQIWPLPARKLWGVGPKTEAYLEEINVRTIGDIASLPLEELIERFGRSRGNYLYEASRGRDENPLVTHWQPKSSSREITFQTDTDNRQFLAKTLSELVREAVNDIRDRGFKSRTVSVKVRFSDFEVHRKAKTLHKPTDSLDRINKTAFECLGKFKLAKKVRLIGIRLSGLAKGEGTGG